METPLCLPQNLPEIFPLRDSLFCEPAECKPAMLSPPWSLHLPCIIAGCLHVPPYQVRAPQNARGMGEVILFILL